MKGLAAAAIAAFFVTPAQAQQNCAPEDIAAVFMQTQHGEQVIEEHSEVINGHLVTWRLWANPQTRAWSLTLSGPSNHGDQITCMVRFGDDYTGLTIAGLILETL